MGYERLLFILALHARRRASVTAADRELDVLRQDIICNWILYSPRRTGIRADSTWQRGLELVVEETVPELRGRWGAQRIAAADAPLDVRR